MRECLPLIMQLINQIRVALIENEKKFYTRFFVLAQSSKGIQYCPYIAQFIVNICIEQYSLLSSNCEKMTTPH